MSATILDSQLKKQLKEENLHYISDSTPGFFRQKIGSSPDLSDDKIGKKFKYYDLEGEVIKDKLNLDRIKKLVIPPAWEKVWISPTASGHLQVTGIDEKGRKQYLYHPDWIKITQENKFDKMIDFGLSLPKIRGRIAYSLKQKTQDKSKILATVIWLLEHTFIRIGNNEYAAENDSFGLTTLHNKHVKIRGSRIYFSFKGKSGIWADIEVSHPTIAKTIKKCIELPGYELFQFIDEDGDKHTVDSNDVNLFLQDTTHEDFSAKDFRTWGASKLSANKLYYLGDDDEKLLKKNTNQTVREVAKHLNNTATICRNYYIHPTVISTYEGKILVPHFQTHSKSKSKISGLSWDEYALIKLLQNY